MAKYIDATKLCKKIAQNINCSVLTEEFYQGAMWVLQMIRKTEREKDVAPVKRGKWNYINNLAYLCEFCGKSFVVEQGDADMNYCPHCGAQMDKE